MGFFSRNKPDNTPRPHVGGSPQPPQPATPVQTFTPIALPSVGLPTVEQLAEYLLRIAGLQDREITRLKGLYPTLAPPNPEHTLGAGDPPNPWTLAVLVAEQCIWDLLNALVVNRGRMPSDGAMNLYRDHGVEGLAEVLRRTGDLSEPLAREATRDVLFERAGNPNHPLGSLVVGYVKEYWEVGVGPKAPTEVASGAWSVLEAAPDGARPMRRVDWDLAAEDEFVYTERVRHNPPSEDLDTFERVEQMAEQLLATRGAGFEFSAWTSSGKRLDPPWMSTKSLAISGEHNLVAAAGHINHGAVGMARALDLGAIGLRNLMWAEQGHPSGMVGPNAVSYLGNRGSGVFVPWSMQADVSSVDIHTRTQRVVALESWGGDSGAVVVLEPDGSRRVLTALNELTGGDRIRFSPDGEWLLVTTGRVTFVVQYETGRSVQLAMGNAGWWPLDGSVLFGFTTEGDSQRPTLFSLRENRAVEEFAEVAHTAPSEARWLNRCFMPEVSPSGEDVLVLTPSGVTAEHQREHGTGSRVALLTLGTGRCEILSDPFYSSAELERDQREQRWVSTPSESATELHPDLLLAEPSSRAGAVERPTVGEDCRQVASVVLGPMAEALDAGRFDFDFSALMPEVVIGLRDTARADADLMSGFEDWLQQLNMFAAVRSRGPLAAHYSAWREFNSVLTAIGHGQPGSYSATQVLWSSPRPASGPQ
jgi:hypothetical protein